MAVPRDAKANWRLSREAADSLVRIAAPISLKVAGVEDPHVGGVACERYLDDVAALAIAEVRVNEVAHEERTFGA
jgi:hypothetical protein